MPGAKVGALKRRASELAESQNSRVPHVLTNCALAKEILWIVQSSPISN